MKTITLKSVGSVINLEDMCVYPLVTYTNNVLANSTYDESLGVNLIDVDDEWFSNLSNDDVDKFREFLNDEIENFNSLNFIPEKVEEGESRFFNEVKYLKSILSKLDKAVVQNNKPKDETLKKLTDIVNWVEDKYDGDELREHMIVKTIKEDLLS